MLIWIVLGEGIYCKVLGMNEEHSGKGGFSVKHLVWWSCWWTCLLAVEGFHYAPLAALSFSIRNVLHRWR